MERRFVVTMIFLASLAAAHAQTSTQVNGQLSG